MIIINHTKRLIVLATDVDSVALTVGSNEVPDTTKLDSKSAKMLMDCGQISVPGGIPEKGNEAIDFSKLKQAEALVVVENSFDKDVLSGYLEQTKNNQVKSAIKARIVVIEQNDKELADELARKQSGNE